MFRPRARACRRSARYTAPAGESPATGVTAGPPRPVGSVAGRAGRCWPSPTARTAGHRCAATVATPRSPGPRPPGDEAGRRRRCCAATSTGRSRPPRAGRRGPDQRQVPGLAVDAASQSLDIPFGDETTQLPLPDELGCLRVAEHRWKGVQPGPCKRHAGSPPSVFLYTRAFGVEDYRHTDNRGYALARSAPPGSRGRSCSVPDRQRSP